MYLNVFSLKHVLRFNNHEYQTPHLYLPPLPGDVSFTKLTRTKRAREQQAPPTSNTTIK